MKNKLDILAVLGTVLVLLKLVGALTFSWWWILSPMLATVPFAIIGYLSKRPKKDK